MSVVRAHPSTALVLGAPGLMALLLTAGCADMATDIGLMAKAPAAAPPDLQQHPPVTQGTRPAAVLSIHTRKAFSNACKFGITLTNNLPYKISELSFRLTAIIDGNVPYDAQTKSFSQLRPSEQTYRDITFQGVQCKQISRIEVADPGRCTLDTLNRFNAAPGDCAKFSEVADSRLVAVVKQAP
jgi:hypothetical protein